MRVLKTGLDREAAIAALRAEGLDVLEWTDTADASYDEHTHPHREVRVVLEGSMTVTLAEGPQRLGPGDRIDLDPGEPHAAVVGPDGVRYLAGRDESP